MEFLEGDCIFSIQLVKEAFHFDYLGLVIFAQTYMTILLGLKPNLYLFTSSFVFFFLVVVVAAAFVCNSLGGDLNMLEIPGAIS